MVSFSLAERRLRAELTVAKNYLEGKYTGNRAKLSLVGHVTGAMALQCSSGCLDHPDDFSFPGGGVYLGESTAWGAGVLHHWGLMRLSPTRQWSS